MIRRKIAQFMYGRYGYAGIDGLNTFVIVVSLVLGFVNLFLFNYKAAHIVIAAIQWILFAIFIFRLVSRNISARRKENETFRRIFSGIKMFIKLQKDRIKDIKKYRYRKCPSCKAVLRLPVKRGSHTARCPKCGERFNVRCLF
ncbi:MAG: hypothetical protein IJT70_00345 [Clostridia bacterium]|nr:hypothetical protein [Clostridia bacterium]